MSQQPAELYGRGKVIRFVADCLERPPKPETSPVMLLLGPRGTGKTALLRRLDARLGAGAPTAWLDFARDPDANPLTVMLNIRRGLSHRVPRVGVIPFPLLKLGLIALSLDPGSDATPEEQLELRLRGLEKQASQVLSDLAQQAKVLLPPGPQVAVGETGVVISWLLSGISSRQRREHLSWYATVAGPGNGTERGPLLELYDRWREDTPAARRMVWSVLCSALLADLRADFNDFSWRHGKRTTNCLLLLDNADTAAGMGLLEALAECRRASHGEAADPLVVVAAQRTRPAPDLAVDAPVIAADDGLLYADWLREARSTEYPSPWCPVRLADLSGDHVRALVKSTVFGTARRDAGFVRALTGGHPGATRQLAGKLGLAAPGFDPRRVLALPAAQDGSSRAGGDCGTVEEDMLSRLRPDWVSDADLGAMAVCVLTPEPRQVACSSVFKYLAWPDVDVRDVWDLLLGLMWAVETPGHELAVRPFPRLLLTRWLARDEEVWGDVHHGYLSHYSGARDTAAVQYHYLALATLPGPGKLGEVATYLDGELAPKRPAAEWNVMLKAITAAPNRLGAVGDQRDAVKQLAGRGEPGDRLRAVTRLVAARWLVGDRLFDPARRLARLVADEYFELARLVEGDTEVFYQESNYFRRIASEWEDTP